MEPRVAQVIDALPGELRAQATQDEELIDFLETLSRRPVPTGRLVRMWALGTLQAKVAAGYLSFWLRSRFADVERRALLKNEANVKAALRLFHSMGYLRGAVLKVGQTLSSYPEVVPHEFVDTLSALHFEAPPMHFSLLREQVRKELGADPEELFAEFDTEAIAAASLGQVHRARLKTGEEVAVKIQYPNIARTIQSDFRNAMAIASAMRFMADWDNKVENFQEIRRTLELETDYVREADFTERARRAFADVDDIVVPRVHREFCSAHILTLDFLRGVHAREFMEGNPSQEDRNAFAAKIMRSCFRLWHSERTVLADPNPGNFILMDDGRLGLIDFGCMREFTDDEVEFMELAAKAMAAGGDAVTEIVQLGALLTDEEMKDEKRVKLTADSCEWMWEPMRDERPFDFSDAEHIQRGFEIIGELVKQRYTRTMPIFNWTNRMIFGVRALFFLLRASVPYKRIHDEELEYAESS